MVLTFNHINLENFMAFENLDLNLNDNGFVSVVGKNLCTIDSAQSNGSGKSTIWEALTWALTGDTIRNCKDVVNAYNDLGTVVKLDFNVDNDNYLIIRSKSHIDLGTNLKIYINGEDKSGKGIRDSEKLLTQYIPDLTPELLGSVIILGQGLPYKFSSNSPSGRKEILEKLSKSNFMVEDVKSRIQKRKLDLNKQLRDSEDSKLSKTTEAAMLDRHLTAINDSITKLGTREAIIRSINIVESELLQFKSDYNRADTELTGLQNSIQALRESYSKLSLDYNRDLRESTAGIETEIQNLRFKLSDVLANKKMIKSNLADLVNSSKKICPTCGQALGNCADNSKLIEEHKSKLSDLDLEDLDINNKISIFKGNLITIKDTIDKKHKDSLNKLDNDIKTAELNHKVLVQSFKEKDAKVKASELNISILNNNLSNYDSRLLELQRDKQNTEDRISDINSKILYINLEIDNIKNKLDISNKLSNIATKNFRAELLKSTINLIDSRAKEYCKVVFDNSNIDFLLDDSKIDIKFNNRSYESLSGGEKQKVDIIVQFSIRDMLCKFLNFSSNIMVLDEIFDNLDSKGCQKIIDVISSKLSDLNSVYIVSHHSHDLSIPYDKMLSIIKDHRGISRLENNF